MRSFIYLDGLRGVASLVVVLWHISFFPTIRPSSGYLAVDLFFCLSGYVLAYAYLDKLLARTMNWRRFFVLRVFRLYPIYIFGAALSSFFVLVALLSGIKINWSWRDFLVSISFSLFFLPTPPFRTDAVFPLNNPAWSLFFELMVNLIFGVFARFLSGRLFYIILICFAVFLGFCIFLNGSADLGSHWESFFGGIPRVVYSFFIGVWLSKLKLSIKVSPFLLYFLVLFLLYLDPGQFRWMYDVIVVVFAFPSIVLLLASGRLNDSSGSRDVELCGFLGSISFPIYMIHIPLFALFNKIQLKYNFSPIWVFGISYFFSLIAASFLINKFYDEPFRRRLVSYFGLNS